MKQKKEVKICGICNLAVDDTHEFCEFTHWKKIKDKLAVNYYHIRCFQDRLNTPPKLQALQNLTADTLIKLREKMGLNITE